MLRGEHVMACVARGRLYGIRSLTGFMNVVLLILLTLLLVRWGLVLWLG